MFPYRKKQADFSRGTGDRLQKIDKIHVLKRCALFASLRGWELSSISKLTRILEFKKDEIVYRTGDPATALYIVISGRFEAFVTGSSGAKNVLAYLKQGAYFGEMSLLAEENHTATVEALSDSLVLVIPKEDFKRIVENNAAIALEISRSLSARVRAQHTPSDRPFHLLKSDVIAVYSAHRKMGQTSFSINLAASLHHETGQRTVLVDMSPTGSVILDRLKIPAKTDISAFRDLEKGVEGTLASHLISHPSGIDVLNLATRDKPDGRSSELITHLLNRLSVEFRFIVVDLPNQIDEVVIKVMTQADHLFFVTDNHMTNVSEVQHIILELEKTVASTDEKTKIVINESFLGFAPTTAVKQELFGEKDCFFLPSTPELKEEGSPEESLVVLSHPDLEYSKVIRLIARKTSKNLIGLALGSGAALGFAHIGVLKILEREKIPVDCIAGSSMGGLVAAFYATGRNATELERIACKVRAFNLLTKIDISLLPIRGLIKGKRFLRFFESLLKDITFEQTKIPLVIVGSSLHSRREVIMDTGPLTQAIRASIAIPGVFKPMKINGETIVDGGIINPLPIRPLQDMGANKIIAVDVLPTPEDTMERRRYLEEMQRRIDAKMQKRNLLFRSLYHMRQAIKELFTPNLFDIIVSSMQTMEHEIADSLSTEADVCIRPSMPLSNWFVFHKAKEIINQGEKAAEAKLEELRTLVRQQTI